MAFYYLLLGHLLGDFVLQTDKIAENKTRYWQWNLLHVLVVTICTLIFSYPFGFILLLMVLVNSLLHFVIDYYKPIISKTIHIPELPGFLIDQLIHILLLYLVSLFATYSIDHFIEYRIIKLLILLVIITSFSAVFTQIILAAAFPRTRSRFFEDGEKYIGILIRIFITFIFFITMSKSWLYLLLLILAAVVLFMQFRLKWSKWMSPSYLAVKLLLDIVISTAGILLIIHI